MATPAISLEVLPAGYGDCLLVTCPVGDRTWRLLVDTGPDETFPALKTRLAQLPADAHGKRHIDLAIISHIDHDHIGGAALLFNERSLGLSFGDIWFNARPRPLARGVAEGESLAELLGAQGLALPWNKAFQGQAAVTGRDGGFVELPAVSGEPRITLLSPNAAALKALFKVWDKELARLRAKESDRPGPPVPVARDIEAPDLQTLAARVTSVDRAVANRSSIAILLEHQGASLLLGADAVPAVMVPALQALAQHRRMPSPIRLDAVKLSHHGSRANVTNELFRLVQADHYIVSTNGAIFGHPDEEAIARVIVHGGRQPRLWFNYDNERSRRWANPALRGLHGYDVMLPESGQPGVALKLAAKG